MSNPYESIGDSAGPRDMASGAKDAVMGAVSAIPIPDINVYLEPINPSATMSMKDRGSLVWQSCKSWSVFADVTQFNIPPLAQWKERVVTNIESYFYNYFILALCFLVVFAFGHFWSVLALVAVLAIAFFLYVINPEPLTIMDVDIGSNAKLAIVVVLSILALFVGHVLKLVFSLLVFLAILVGVHGSIREHTNE